MSTLAFASHDKIVALAEWVANFCIDDGVQGPSNSRSQTLASDEVRGCCDQVPSAVGAGIIGCCSDPRNFMSILF